MKAAGMKWCLLLGGIAYPYGAGAAGAGGVPAAALQGKSDVSGLRERDQTLARARANLGKSGNPGVNKTGPQVQQVQCDYQAGPEGELLGDPTVPHRPSNTMGAGSGSAC
jgi:hypothetical protein